MSDETYYLTDYDGSVCRANPDGEDVALDEFEVVTELNRLRKALGFYADRKHWKVGQFEHGGETVWDSVFGEWDVGKIARAALHTEEEEKR